MSVLRESRDSLVAMLEAFVHDPLISWRLLGTQARQEEASRHSTSAGAAPSPSAAAPPPALAPPQNLERIAVPPRMSSPRAGEPQVVPSFVANLPPAGQPPPTPRLGPVNPGQRANSPHGARVVAQPAAPAGYALGISNNAGLSGNNAGGETGVGWSGGPGVAMGAPGAATAAPNGYAGRVSSAGAGGVPPPVRGPRGSSIQRPLTLAGMTPLQPVPEIGRGSRESDAESDVTGDDLSERDDRHHSGAEGSNLGAGTEGRGNAAAEASSTRGVGGVGIRTAEGTENGGVAGLDPESASITHADTSVRTAGAVHGTDTGGAVRVQNGVTILDTIESAGESDPGLARTSSAGTANGDILDVGQEGDAQRVSDPSAPLTGRPGKEEDQSSEDEEETDDDGHARGHRTNSVGRPAASAAVDMRPRAAPASRQGEGVGGAGGAGEGVADEDDEEEERVALAAVAAAALLRGGSMAQSDRNRSNSLLQQSSSFRPNMHLQIQALSNRNNGTYTGTFSARWASCSCLGRPRPDGFRTLSALYPKTSVSKLERSGYPLHTFL